MEFIENLYKRKVMAAAWSRKSAIGRKGWKKSTAVQLKNDKYLFMLS